MRIARTIVSGAAVLLVAGAVILVGALSFVPALALGPLAETLQPIAAAAETRGGPP